jgi:Protein of unknown function (DUF3987)
VTAQARPGPLAALSSTRSHRGRPVGATARLATARQIRRASDLDHGGVDATPEALAGLLATYGRIALVSPEGDVFDQMAGRYNQAVGPNLGVYLKGHAGDLLRIDRRGRPEYVEPDAAGDQPRWRPAVRRPTRARAIHATR